MPILRILQGEKQREVAFTGTPLVGEVLREAGVASMQPCGGRGLCGKCAVVLRGCVSPANEAEQRAGTRLSCQAVLLGDAEVSLPQAKEMEQIEGSSLSAAPAGASDRYAAALDMGTTTLALHLLSLPDGQPRGACGRINPQTTVAADVMGRIGAALAGEGSRLQEQLLQAIRALLEEACKQAGCTLKNVERMVATGNTTMLYLLTGRSPQALAQAPFAADCLFDCETILWGIPTYLPPCIHAFVGADITCALLASRLCQEKKTALLCDIGTNGEIALWHGGRLWVASTAAGPAFEGAGIVMGCGSVRGAIDSVRVVGEKLEIHTIGDAPAVGVCGSGLIDGVAALLQQERVDATGAMEEGEAPLSGGVSLFPQDIRNVQLAKAALAAGMETLLTQAGITCDQVERLVIAGGFGSHLRMESAAAIGLIPTVLASRAQAVGNAALAGAEMLLRTPKALEEARALASRAIPVNLGGNPVFNEAYMEQMLFPEKM